MKNEKTKGKKIKVILIVIASTLCVTCIAAYLFVLSYIYKMNLVHNTNESKWTDTIPEDFMLDDDTDEDIDEDIEGSIPNASEEEINIVEEEIRRNMEENSKPILYDKNVFHVLLIGSDTRKVGERGRSDAMILISINKKKKTITATSLLRDIYLQISKDSYNRINTAYAYGGPELLLETIKNNFKIEIDDYVSVNFFDFVEVIDALGGLELEISEEEIPVLKYYMENINRLTEQQNEEDQISKAGTYLMNGKEVLSYARIRYVGNGDFGRTARQRKVLEQIYKKVKGMGILEINSLLNAILPKVTTNLSEGEIFSLILSLPSFKNYTFQQWSIPIEGSYSFMRIRGMDVIKIDFDKNISELKRILYDDET